MAKITKVDAVPEKEQRQGKWVRLLTGMKAGEVLKIEADEGEDIKKMRSAISSSGSHIREQLAGKLSVTLHEDVVYVEMKPIPAKKKNDA